MSATYFKYLAAQGMSAKTSFNGLQRPACVFLAALLLRLLFLFYGLWQDERSRATPGVPAYTDIDVHVVQDAVKMLRDSESPYGRPTYRYTPLLAWLVYPLQLSIGEIGPKMIYALCDLLAGLLMWKIRDLTNSGAKGVVPYTVTFGWLLNPMVITLSTRGSAEPIMSVLVLMVLHSLIRFRKTKSNTTLYTAAAIFGLSVHFKLYPVIHVFSIMAFLRSAPSRNGLFGLVADIVNYDFLRFGLISGTVFTLLNYAFYQM